VVDDHPMVLEGMRSMLAQIHYQISVILNTFFLVDNVHFFPLPSIKENVEKKSTAVTFMVLDFAAFNF
jgi:hypothetical protein